MPMSERREPECSISVIVPVQDSPEGLEQLLDSLRGQTLPRDAFEVIVSDDGSDEPPFALATDDGHVKVVSGPRSSSYAARNRGVAASRGRQLAFCDGDCVAEPAWLERGLEALEDADIVAGRIQFILPDRVTVWTLIDMDTSKNQRQLVELGVGETANLFVRRELFERLGGFDPRFPSHGDYDFVERCVKSGARLAYSADAVVWHPTRDDAGGILRTQWVRCRSYAKRMTWRREQVEGLKLRSWVPVLHTARGRRKAGMPFTIATPWIAENGVRPTFAQRTLSLPIVYLLVPYWRNVAEVAGAIDGRRSSEAQPASETPTAR